MMSGWQEVRLGDVGRIITGKTPSTKIHNFWDGNIPFVTPGDLQTHKHIFSTERYISTDGLNSIKGAILPTGAICVSCIGVLGYVGITTRACASNQQINSVVPSWNFDKDYVFYAIKSLWPKFKQFEGTSSVVSILNKSAFSNFTIPEPSRQTQRKIAAVLSALDDKIELNNRINANLEAQVQALFRSWFVDFEPWGGTMPEGWRKGKLGTFCDCVLGGTPSRDKPDYWNGNIPWINSGKVNELRIVEPSEKISQRGLNFSAAKLLPRRTTVIAITGATLGQISLTEIETTANQSVVGVVASSTFPSEYLYPFICKNREELMSYGTGGAQQHINKQNVGALDVLIPDAKTLERYVSMLRPIFDRMANGCFQNVSLASLRDALLPKLMNGEIDVSQVEIPA